LTSIAANLAPTGRYLRNPAFKAGFFLRVWPLALSCYRAAMEHQWVRPVVTAVLCLVAAALLWYGAGVLFDRPPESDDAASLGY
jgi:hypothetical protein